MPNAVFVSTEENMLKAVRLQIMPDAAKMRRPRRWSMREIVNAIFYVMCGGIGWWLLPYEIPHRSKMFRWSSRFRDEYVFEKIDHHLQTVDRERCGREVRLRPQSSIASQTCESGRLSTHVRAKGRKRHALVDTHGRALALFAHPASIRDRSC